MGAWQTASLGNFNAVRLERSHILQAFAGMAAVEGQTIGYQKINLLIAHYLNILSFVFGKTLTLFCPVHLFYKRNSRTGTIIKRFAF